MKQADSSLIPIISVVDEGLGEICFHAGLPIHSFSILEKVAYVLPRKSSHKDTSISVIFRTFLLGKLINSVDPQGNTSSYQGLRQQQRKELWKYMPIRVPLE